jgi:putative Holliday junction resolvase
LWRTSLDLVAYRETVLHTKSPVSELGSGCVRPGVRLAFDLGSARIGVASSDGDALLASPLTTVRRGRGDLDRLAELTTAHQAVEVLVGLPTGLSGREGAAAARARAFARALAARLAPVPVRLVDERFTTVLAHSALRQAGHDSRQRRSVVDQAAAALILQGVLDTERATGGPVGEVVGLATGAAG